MLFLFIFTSPLQVAKQQLNYSRSKKNRFTFKNLTVLEKQNLEALRKLKSEHVSSSPIHIPREQAGYHQRSSSTSGSLQIRRAPSLSSSFHSTAVSPPSNHAPWPPRSSMPSSPLISSQSRTPASASAKQRSSSLMSIGIHNHDRVPGARLPSDPVSPTKAGPISKSLPTRGSPQSSRVRSLTVGADARPEVPFSWTSVKRISKVFEPDTPSSSSDTEASSGAKALQRVQRRRQRSKRPSTASLAHSLPSRSFRALDVLICEDNPVSRKVLEAMLKKLKCRVVSVVDGAQAVAAATGDVVFDVIFTDIKVPRLSGVEVARLIRSSSGGNAETPIIAMSSYSPREYNDTARYFEKRLEKPLTLLSISETLQEVLQDWCESQTSTKSKTDEKGTGQASKSAQ